jgi:membrane protease YdiL (CAAX protease family)
LGKKGFIFLYNLLAKTKNTEFIISGLVRVGSSDMKLSIENIKTNPNRKLLVISILFLTYWVPSISLSFGLIPIEFISIDNLKLPTYQMVQIFVFFPLILFVSYHFFIRNKLIKWSDLGFNLGNKGLLKTTGYGVIGGVIQGAYIFFTSNHFILRNRIWLNFFEKCISAPIWEEFLFRVLLFSMIEMFMLFRLKRIDPDSRYYKLNKIAWYINIIGILAIMFSLMHGEISSYIVSFAIIATLVYMKTRSIIAPVLAHSLSNFVSGGFLYLILNSII